ncbi:MAG: M48 family metalloprotease, partial [Acidobacteriia bacterium]|nr:M48 family metalloprotease [Terriglobia bacterium]
MRRLVLPVLLLTAAVMAACATNPVTGKRELSLMSEEQELQIGREQDVQVRKEMGVYSDEALQKYIMDIGVRLSRVSERPELPWHYTVVDSPAINAFALPGGYIYITRGIMPFLDDESQVAGVLGHETGHVTARHANQQYSRSTSAGLGLLLGSIFVPAARPFASLGQSGLGVLMLKYGRDDEAQADALGVKYASTAGWDPAGVPAMLTTLGRIEEASDSKGVPNWLQTHPVAEDRIQRVQAAVRDAEKGADRFTTDREGYLKRITGLVYGDNPDQGVVRNGSFLHAGLRFAVEFPQGWDINNGQTQVVAKQSGENALILLQEVQRPVGRSIQEISLRSMEGAGFRELDGGRTTINGLDAFIGTYAGTVQDFGRVTVRAAHVVHDRSIFLVAGIASQAIYDRFEPAFTKSLNSFRPLTRAEAESIHPNRIDLYTAREGDTWQGIAEHQGKGVVKASTLAIMNGHP